MPKLTTITVPTETGTAAMNGYVVNIPLNIGRTDLPDAPTVKFLIEIRNDGSVGNLTHYATGALFYTLLSDLQLRHRLAKGSYAAPLSKRALAEEAVFQVVKTHGITTVLNAIAKYPTLNP